MSTRLQVEGHRANGRGDVEATISLLKDGVVAHQDVVNLSRAQARSRFAQAVGPLIGDDDFDVEAQLLRWAEELRGLVPGQQSDRYTARFPGLVDIVDVAGEPQFLVLQAGELRPYREWNSQQPPPREQLPWLLPRLDQVLQAYDGDNDAVLFNDLVAFFRSISLLPTEDHYVLLADWAAHTHLMEWWQYTPYLVFFAVPERGKSRTGKALTYLSYRGIHTETLQEANVFRWSEDLGATVFFDVRDLWRKAERRGCDDILLQRYERGAKVGRVLWPDRGKHRDTRYFDIFGPTIIATNEAIGHILDTRAVTIIMPDADRDYPEPVTPELCLPLKERLTALRARHLNGPIPDGERLTWGRLGDILVPLSATLEILAPQCEPTLRRLVASILDDRLVDKRASIEGRILEVLLKLETDVESGKLSTSAITERLNEGWPERYHKNSVAVGRKLTALGLARTRMSDGAAGIEYDPALVRRLAKKYGVPLENPSDPSEPSGSDTNEPKGSPDPSENPPEPSGHPSADSRYRTEGSEGTEGSVRGTEPEKLEADKVDFRRMMAERGFPPFECRNAEGRAYKKMAAGSKALDGFLATASAFDMDAAWEFMAGEAHSNE